MDERRPHPPESARGPRLTRPGTGGRSAVAAFERAAVHHHRRGGPRVEGRRLTVVAVARDEAELRAAVAGGADAVRLVFPAAALAAAPPDAGWLAALVGHGRASGCRVWAAIPEAVPQPALGAAAALRWALRQGGVEAVEVGDLGLLRLLRDALPDLAAHAGAALGARSTATVLALAGAGARRVVLPPDVTPSAVRAIAAGTAVELEVPLHGPACFALGGCAFGGAPGASGRGGCFPVCAAALAAAPPPALGVGHAPARSFRRVSELQAAGAAAVRVAPGAAAALGAAVLAFRLAADAGPVLDDETDARAGRLVDGAEAGPDPPDRLAGGPSGLAVQVLVEAGAEGVRVAVADRRGTLAETAWPVGGAPCDPAVLEDALRPPATAGLRLETLTQRGAAGLPPPGTLERLWAAVAAALARQREALLSRARGEGGHRPPPPRLAPLVTLGLSDLAAAAALLRDDGVDRAEVPLAALDRPGADAGAVGPTQRARLYLALPQTTGESDLPDLGRRLRRLADGGFAGVVAHDLGQVALAGAAGVAVTAGAGLTALNEEAVALLADLGCRAATLALSQETADWVALLAARPVLPLRAPVHGWFPVAATRLPLPEPPAEGWTTPDGAPLRPLADERLTLLVPAAPVDRTAAAAALADAGLRELLLDLRGAPPDDPRGAPGALLAPFRRGGAAGPPDGGLASAADRTLEQRLGRLYGAADRLTRAFRDRHGLACSSACARCCAQLVPVWPVEAVALVPGVRALAATQSQRLALRRRAEQQLAEQAAAFREAGLRPHPSDMPVWRVQPGQLEPLVDRAWSPCVLLADGRCSVYERRPLLCRVYGFPTAAIPGNLCRRLSAPLLDAATNGRMPSIPAAHVHRLGEAIRRLQGLPDGVTDITTVAAIVCHSLR